MKQCPFCNVWTQLESCGLCSRCLSDSRKVEQIVREWKELKLYKKAMQDKESERERQVAAAEQIKETYGYEVMNLQRKLVVANEKIAELELYKKATQAVQGAVDKTANEVIQQLRDRLAIAREGLMAIKPVIDSYYKDLASVSATPYLAQIEYIVEQTLAKMKNSGVHTELNGTHAEK